MHVTYNWSCRLRYVSDDLSLNYRKSSANRRMPWLEELKRLLRFALLAMQDGPEKEIVREISAVQSQKRDGAVFALHVRRRLMDPKDMFQSFIHSGWALADGEQSMYLKPADTACHDLTYQNEFLVNPRRTCAARVTVLGLCVCLSVCLCVCVCVCYSTSHFTRNYSCYKRY